MNPAAEQLDAYNARDLERFLSCYSADVVIQDGRGNRIMQGLEELRAKYRELFEASPELHCRLVHRTEVGDYVIDEEKVTGLGNRGSDEIVHAVAIYRIEDEKIVHVSFLK